jgi:beta-phosphoglucomutase family hydrolase
MLGAVIFDMDGVISDTQKLHAQAESDLLARFGISLSAEAITRRYAGVRTRDFFDDLLQETGKRYDLDQLMDEKWRMMRDAAAISVEPVRGARELIAALSALECRMAVASASPSEYVRTVLEQLDVRRYFSAVVAGDMVARGKPDPESFLLAAQRIGVAPRHCVVIEDGVSGMEAAARAGMRCVGLVDDVSQTYPTRHLVESLVDVTPAYLRRIAL